MNISKASTLQQLFKIISAAVFYFAVIGFSQSNAQNNPGKITGKIIDSKSGEPAIGANVAIETTTEGAATDIGGKYSIGGIAGGTYTIIVSYVSYASQKVAGVKVESGKTTTLDISLQSETYGLHEVTVSAGAITNSEAGLLSTQRKAIAFQDGLSSEFINKSGDSNVATAMKCIPGVMPERRRGAGGSYFSI